MLYYYSLLDQYSLPQPSPKGFIFPDIKSSRDWRCNLIFVLFLCFSKKMWLWQQYQQQRGELSVICFPAVKKTYSFVYITNSQFYHCCVQCYLRIGPQSALWSKIEGGQCPREFSFKIVQTGNGRRGICKQSQVCNNSAVQDFWEEEAVKRNAKGSMGGISLGKRKEGLMRTTFPGRTKGAKLDWTLDKRGWKPTPWQQGREEPVTAGEHLNPLMCNWLLVSPVGSSHQLFCTFWSALPRQQWSAPTACTHSWHRFCLVALIHHWCSPTRSLNGCSTVLGLLQQYQNA